MSFVSLVIVHIHVSLFQLVVILNCFSVVYPFMSAFDITYNYPRRAWATTGIVVCQSVCLFFSICSPGCHSTAFTAWIAFTQQVITFKSGRF